MSFRPPSNFNNFVDLENFPPPRGLFDTLPVSFKMPAFVKNEELRKGPRQQDVLTWMIVVQTCLDDFTSWDRRLNGKFGARVHEDMKLCQIARITPRAMKTTLQKAEALYIKEDLQPAMELLEDHERMRQIELTKLRANTAKQSETQVNNRKRKQEDEAESQSVIKKIKQEADQKLNNHVESLQALRKLVNEKLGAADIEVSKRFHALERDILELMAAEDWKKVLE
ncbi:hypothetical protein D6D23_07866 [Aureobasidium pullulans]|uniref:Uncharacterized protein n=1 Tax=Aureobasidium pullulans TaxID=5580 RepID=A0A4S8W0J4_AURPU|nr:hypothetical protein D6D24_09359 [Aureobasidium pullulans]THW18018.1 hypothetical protein D6D23_07866 [Aureobasidium pullulans]